MQTQFEQAMSPQPKRFRRLGQAGKQFLGLRAVEQRLFLTALLLLPGTVIGLRLWGFQRWYAWLHWWGQRARRRQMRVAATDAQCIRRTRLLLQLAIRYAPHRGNCLSRSLTLWWLLQRQGIDSDLRIGVRQLYGLFQAHAWIEYAGQPLNESPQVRHRYATFAQPIAPRVESASPRADYTTG
ncbi:MAG: lasso peptide biosynthesis B2 protein [Caldilineaceae bacterium]